MAERIGVEAIVDLTRWDRGMGLYLTGLTTMRARTLGFVGDMVDQFDLLGKVTLGIGAGLATALGGTAAVVLKEFTDFTTEGISQAADLEDQMAAVAAAMGIALDAVQPLKDEVIELGVDPRLKVTTFEAADVMLMLAKNGITMQESLDGAAEASIALANATGGDFAMAADVVTDVMRIFNIEAGEVERVIDGVTGVVNKSKFDLNDYFLALSNGAAILSGGINGSFEDFNTTITLVSNAFNTGRRAGTGFSQFVVRLPGITEKARERMAQYGIIVEDTADKTTLMSEESSERLNDLQKMWDSTTDSIWKYENGLVGAGLSEEARQTKITALKEQLSNIEAQMRPLEDSMQDAGKTVSKVGNRFFDAQGNFLGLENAAAVLNETLADLSDIERSLVIKDIFGVDAQEIVVRLMEEGAEGFREIQNELANVSGFEAAEKRMSTFRGALEILGGELEAIGILIGDQFIDSSNKFIRRMNELIEVNRLSISSAWQPTAQAFNTLLSNMQPLIEAAIPSFIVVIENLNKIVASLIIRFNDMLVNVFPTFVEWLREGSEWLMRFVGDGEILNDQLNDMPASFQNLIRSLVETYDAISNVWSFFVNLKNVFLEILSPVIEWIKQNVTLTDTLIGLSIAVGVALSPLLKFIASLSLMATAISVVVSKVRDQLSGDTFEQIINAIRSGFNLLVSDISVSWESLVPVVQHVLKRISDLTGLTEAWYKFLGFLRNIDWDSVFEGIGIAAKVVWEAVVEISKFAFDRIREIIQAIDWASIFGNIRTAIENLWRFVKQKTIVIWGEITEWFKNIDWEQVWEDIRTAAENLWETAKEKTIEAWEGEGGIKDTIVKSLTAIYEKMDEGMTGPMTEFGTFMAENFPRTALAFIETIGAIGEALDILREPIVATTEETENMEEAWKNLAGTLDVILSSFIEIINSTIIEFALGIKALRQIIAGDFDGALETIKQSWQLTGETLNGVLDNFTGLLEDAANDSVGSLEDLSTNSLSEIDKLIAGLEEKTGVTADAARGFREGFTEGLAPLPSEIGAELDAMEPFIKIELETLESVFRSAGSLSMEGFANALGYSGPRDQAVQSTQDFVDEIVLLASAIDAGFYDAGSDSVQGYIQGLAEQEHLSVTRATDWANNIINGVEQTLGVKSPSTVFARIAGDTIEGFIHGLASNQERLQSFFGGIFESMVDTVRTKTTEIINEFKNFLETIINDANDLLQGLLTVFIDRFQEVVNVVTENLDAMFQVVKEATENIIGTATEFVENMVEVVVNGFKDLVDTFVSSFDEIVEVTTKGFKEVFSIVKESVEDILKKTNEFINEMVSIVDEGFNELLDTAVDILKNLVSEIDEKTTAIVDKVSSATSNIVETFISGFQEVRDTVVSAMTDISTNLTNAFDTARNAVVSAMEAIRNSVRSVMDEITGRFSGLADEVRNSINLQSFFDIGSNLVGGFIEGVNNRLNDARNKLSELIQIAQDAANTEAEISSPSKLFAWTGEMSAEGYVMGWVDRMESFVNSELPRTIQASRIAIDRENVEGIMSQPGFVPQQVSNVTRSNTNSFGPIYVQNGMDVAEFEYRVRRIVAEEVGAF